MNCLQVISAPISHLYSLQATSIPLSTVRLDLPLPPPPKESDPPVEHATFSCLLHTEITGTIVLRVLHGGLIIELLSLSSDVVPIRFVFPSPVISFPALFLWESQEIHVVAVTDAGSLYRIIVPIRSTLELWRNEVSRVWPKEYVIHHRLDMKKCVAHVHGVHCVVLGLPNGSLLRLENDIFREQVEWSETVFHHTTFLSTLTSFLPSMTAGIPDASDIISIATHPWPTDIGDVWTLSRDRTLRAWRPGIGCVASKTISTAQDSALAQGTTGWTPANLLLDSTPRTLLSVFPSPLPEDELVYLLVFIPSVSSPTSGGTFYLFDITEDQFISLSAFEASKNSSYCHLQHFLVVGNSLYTLWDRHGQVVVENIELNFETNDENMIAETWHTSPYFSALDLMPSEIEEHLLSPGSMTDKFLEAVTRPGVFSNLTLKLAIDQYTDACLSIPGPPPSQLLTVYASISENISAVVGCTVGLNRDPQTGAYQHGTYWSALKRDWEGFIARCREFERSAGRPLALGIRGPREIVVLERERAGILVAEDLPLQLRRRLDEEFSTMESQNELLTIMWKLRNKFGNHALSNIENHLMDALNQKVDYSIPDILQDLARRFNLRDDIEESFVYEIVDRLQGLPDVGAAVRTTLNLVGGLNLAIKQEEDLEILNPLCSEWYHALTGVYISRTIEARYDLCLSLVAMLFFLVDELSDWDPSLLAEILSVFRGVTILKYVARQPASEMSKIPHGAPNPDDVISRMQSMNVSNPAIPATPSYSLIDLLLNFRDIQDIVGAAHRFLDTTGLLQSFSPSHATREEVQFIERLRLQGFLEASHELATWLPRTPAVSYTLSRLWLDLGRFDDASYLLEKVSGCFGTEHAMSAEDKDALASVLPAAEQIESKYSFCVHVSGLFKKASAVQHEVLFAQLGISVAPAGEDTSSLWCSVFKGFIDLASYEDAYATLITMPYDRLRRDYVGQLVYRMCEDNAINTLIRFNFTGLDDEAEHALAFKARNVDPRSQPPYSKILYTWYISRGDYRNAALVMYQQTRKLKNHMTTSSSFLSLADTQREAYTIAINALSLVDERNAWVLLSFPVDKSHEFLKRRKLLNHIPDDKYSSGRFDADIIRLKDMQFEMALLTAQLDAIQHDPTLLSSLEFLLQPPVIVLRLAQSNRFCEAMTVARSLNVDMTDLFNQLTRKCLRLSRNPDADHLEEDADWLLMDKVSTWRGTVADRCWRYLRQSLQHYDNAETDYKYSKGALETILSFNRTSPPPWLTDSLENYHHEYLIRVNLRYENIEEAIAHTLTLIRKADTQLERAPKSASSTWLPYTLIDQVLIAASAEDSSTSQLSILRQELANRVKRMQKLSQFTTPR